MNNNSFFEAFENGGVRIALVGALSILALFLLAQTITLAASFGRSGVPATDTITVNGDGQAALAPDVAHITFTVQHTAPAVSDAQTATVQQANDAIDFVKKQGVAEKDIKTLSYNISPQYSYPNPCGPGVLCPTYSGSPKITGYEVSETVQVTVRDLTKVGAMLSGLGEFGVQNVSGPEFALDDATAGYDAARADAIDKAKAQAQVLAKQLDVRLGKIVNFSESSGGYGRSVYAMDIAYGKGGEAAPAPEIQTGENTYTASVSITYEIR
jgi:uncharacterized protein YggE